MLFGNYACAQSFFDVVHQPAKPVLQSFLRLGRAGCDRPLSVFHLLHFEILQYLATIILTSSGCSACTRSCLLANIKRGTPASYFSCVGNLVQLGASTALCRLTSLAWCLPNLSHRPARRYWWSNCPSTLWAPSVLRCPRRWVWIYREWDSWCWSPGWEWWWRCPEYSVGYFIGERFQDGGLAGVIEPQHQNSQFLLFILSQISQNADQSSSLRGHG